MEHSSLENPWNLKLEPFFSDCKNSNALKKRGFIGEFIFKNKPRLFTKGDDLVFCNVCNILLSKKGCLKHTQLHDSQSKDIDLVYTVSSHDVIKKEIPQCDLLNDSEKLNMKATRSKDKKRKISEPIVVRLNSDIDTPKEDIVICDDPHNFVPKSTLNAENPLRIKIQLQPRPTNGIRNDNVFEYISSFCNDPKSHTSNESRINGEGSAHRSWTRESNNVLKKKPTEMTYSLDLHRSCPATIVCGSASQYQTSSFQNHGRVEIPQLSQLPQVFQRSNNKIDSSEGYLRNCVRVKGLNKTLKPVSSTHSLDSSFGSTDQNQKSLKKIFIDNGVFRQVNAQRSHKSNTIVESGHINKARIISSSPLLHVPNESNATRPTPARLLEHHTIRPLQHARSNTVMASSEPLIASQPGVRIHNSQYYSSRDLVAGDFFYDSSRRSNLSVQTSAPRSDSDVHYLPPGSATIMSLPWEI